MEPLIYYPNFEPPSEIWLKFALLYFEDLKSIVPYERQHLISSEYQKIKDETDLVSLYSPDSSDGHMASLRAIEEVEKILNTSLDRSLMFNQTNILRKWRKPNSWTYLIYGEKFSHSWNRFCVENKLAKQKDVP